MIDRREMEGGSKKREREEERKGKRERETSSFILSCTRPREYQPHLYSRLFALPYRREPDLSGSP